MVLFSDTVWLVIQIIQAIIAYITDSSDYLVISNTLFVYAIKQIINTYISP